MAQEVKGRHPRLQLVCPVDPILEQLVAEGGELHWSPRSTSTRARLVVNLAGAYSREPLSLPKASRFLIGFLLGALEEASAVLAIMFRSCLPSTRLVFELLTHEGAQPKCVD